MIALTFLSNKYFISFDKKSQMGIPFQISAPILPQKFDSIKLWG
jgi:hypothetical protein